MVTWCIRYGAKRAQGVLHHQRFDPVVPDQAMPGLIGDKLAERLLRYRPDLPIILCTGFSQTSGPQRALEIGMRGFVMNPCPADQVADAVRRALAGDRAATC